MESERKGIEDDGRIMDPLHSSESLLMLSLFGEITDDEAERRHLWEAQGYKERFRKYIDENPEVPSRLAQAKGEEYKEEYARLKLAVIGH